MQVLLGFINVLLILNAIVLIISVLMQEGSRQGLGVIAGGAETFFGKSKGKSYEAKLEMITKVGVATFIVLAILMTAINSRLGISNTAPVDLSQAPSVSDLLDEKKLIQGTDLDTTLPAEAETAADEVAQTAENALSSAEGAVEGAAVEAENAVEGAAAEVENAASDVAANAEAAVADAAQNVEAAAADVVQNVEAAATDVVENAEAATADAVDAVTDAVEEVATPAA